MKRLKQRVVGLQAFGEGWARMGFSGFLLIAGGLIGVLFVLERLIKKWFAIDEEVLQSTPAKKIESWSRWVMVIALLVLYRIMTQGGDAYIFWILSVLTVVTAVEVYFEWKLLKGSRKYQMTLVSYVLGILVIMAILSL